MALCTPAWDVTTSCALCTYCSADGAASTAVARSVSARKKRLTSCKGLPAAVLVAGVSSWTGTGISLQHGRGGGVRQQPWSSSEHFCEQCLRDCCCNRCPAGQIWVSLQQARRWRQKTAIKQGQQKSSPAALGLSGCGAGQLPAEEQQSGAEQLECSGKQTGWRQLPTPRPWTSGALWQPAGAVCRSLCPPVGAILQVEVLENSATSTELVHQACHLQGAGEPAGKGLEGVSRACTCTPWKQPV